MSLRCFRETAVQMSRAFSLPCEKISGLYFSEVSEPVTKMQPRKGSSA